MNHIHIVFVATTLALAATACGQNKPATDPSASGSGTSSSTASTTPPIDAPGAEWANAPDGETSTAVKGGSLSPGNSMGTVDYGSGTGSNGTGAKPASSPGTPVPDPAAK